jgi:hypothetical protein
MSEWSAAELEALFAADSEFVRQLALRAHEDRVPYSRVLEGYPEWLMMSAAQWEVYDGLNAHCDEMDRKYGPMLPKSLSSMRAVARRIY